MTIHFTGIKGVGMTALAQVLQDQGQTVQGSDTEEWFITDPVLKKRSIAVFERFTPRNLFRIENSKKIPTIDKLIYTGAHHGAQNVEVKWAASRGIPTINYAQALGEVFKEKKQICVCGVGGKTTTTAMLATILYNASPSVISSESSSREIQQSDPNHTAGARSLDFGTSRRSFARDDKKAGGMTGVSWVIGTSDIQSLPSSGKWGQGEWAVIESDEYVADPQADKTPKFMYLNPEIIICTNIHHDHPDMYPTEQDTIQAYLKFFEKLPKDGVLFLSSQAKDILSSAGSAFAKASSDRPAAAPPPVVYDEDETLEKAVKGVIQVPGDYNVKNAMAAVMAAEYIGVSREEALGGLKKYTGSKRRFELIADVNGVKLYDDYAHHPGEIEGLLKAAREKFPDSRIRFVFQPHTFSRTKALLHEFAHSLKGADETVMFPIFASARESADPTVSSKLLAEEIMKMGGKAIYLPTKQKLVQYLCQTVKPPEVIFTVGAGNLYDIHNDLIGCLTQARKTSS